MTDRVMRTFPEREIPLHTQSELVALGKRVRNLHARPISLDLSHPSPGLKAIIEAQTVLHFRGKAQEPRRALRRPAHHSHFVCDTSQPRFLRISYLLVEYPVLVNRQPDPSEEINDNPRITIGGCALSLLLAVEETYPVRSPDMMGVPHNRTISECLRLVGGNEKSALFEDLMPFDLMHGVAVCRVWQTASVGYSLSPSTLKDYQNHPHYGTL